MYSAIKHRNDDIIKVDQGDIYKNINFIKNIKVVDDELEVEQIEFENVLVLSQSCDLHREQEKEGNEILTVLVVPLFEVESFKRGEHLKEIGKKCETVGKKLMDRYSNGEHERYYVVQLTSSDKEKFKISDDYIIDFRYFFTADITQFLSHNYVMSLDDLFKEKVTQRFSNYLSRIGLPVITEEKNDF